jgi:hypothetical protein
MGPHHARQCKCAKVLPYGKYSGPSEGGRKSEWFAVTGDGEVKKLRLNRGAWRSSIRTNMIKQGVGAVC